MINYHPAFSWYSLLLFAVFVIALVIWARRRVLTENELKETMINDHEWLIVTSCQPEVHDSQNSLITAFVAAFEQVVDTSIVLLSNLEVAIKSLPYKQQFLMFPELLMVINHDASGESWNCIARGHTLMLVLYSNRGEDEEISRYSEIGESGVLDRPKRLLFSVHYASSPLTDFQGKRCQCVILVPANDQLHRNNRPFLLIADISSLSEAAGE